MKWASRVAYSENKYPNRELQTKWMSEYVEQSIAKFKEMHPDREIEYMECNLVFDDSEYNWRLQVVIPLKD